METTAPKLLVQAHALGNRAILIDGHGAILRYFHAPPCDNTPRIGDIYCVIAKSPLPGGNGWFVDIPDNSAMLRNPHDDVAQGQKLLAQITRNNAKGYSLGQNLRICGRYVALNCNAHGIEMITTLPPANKISQTLMDNETSVLRAQMQACIDGLTQSQQKLYAAPDFISQLLHMAPSNVEIHVDDPHLAHEIDMQIQQLYPDLLNSVEAHPAFQDLLQQFDVDDIYDDLCAQVLPLRGGGRLHIEQTNACVCFDIDQAQAPLHQIAHINRVAMGEIARLVALRQYGGNIIIDPISYRRRGYLAVLLGVLNTECKTYNVAMKAIHVTKLGLLEISVQYQDCAWPERLNDRTNIAQKAHLRAVDLLRALPHQPTARDYVCECPPDVADILQGDLAEYLREYSTMRAINVTINRKADLTQAYWI